jgi:hypothetical protein
VIAKSLTIEGASGKSGGCALKAVHLIAGDLLYVPEPGLRIEQFILTVQQLAWWLRMERSPER